MASKKPEAQPEVQPATVQVPLRKGHSYPQSLGTKRISRFRQEVVLPADDTTSDEEKLELEEEKLSKSKGK